MREAASFIARQGVVDASLLARVEDLFVGIVRNWRNRRQVVSLSDFDDHMLADIGLSRGDIEQALDTPFAEDPSLALQQIALRNRASGWNR